MTDGTKPAAPVDPPEKLIFTRESETLWAAEVADGPGASWCITLERLQNGLAALYLTQRSWQLQDPPCEYGEPCPFGKEGQAIDECLCSFSEQTGCSPYGWTDLESSTIWGARAVELIARFRDMVASGRDLGDLHRQRWPQALKEAARRAWKLPT